MQWNFPATPGLEVEVRLLFAETYSGITGAGQRVFNVKIEGQIVLEHFDIYAQHGYGRGVMKAFITTVSGDGNLDIDFVAITENPLINGIEIVTRCLTSTSTTNWQNTPFIPQTARFAVEYQAASRNTNIDGLFGLSAQAGFTYSDYAVLVRFNNSGNIDARDGGSYRADNVIPYSADTIYHIRVAVNTSTHRYSVYVTPPDGYERTVATNYGFRTEQSGITSFANWGIQCGSGTLEICQVAIYPYVHNATMNTWHPTIQAAVDAAASNDELVLSQGTYTGTENRDVDNLGKSLTIRSADPADPAVVASTVIDCQASVWDRHRAFTLQSEQPCSVLIQGLTLINGCAPRTEAYGYPASLGGAISCTGVSMNIDRCDFRNNSAFSEATHQYYQIEGYGGAVYCIGPQAIITNSSFSGNSVRPVLYYYGPGDTYGGAIYCDCGLGTHIENCTISDNGAYGAYVTRVGHGGGIYLKGSATVAQCTISNNTAGGSEGAAYGGGILSNGSLIMTNCVVSGNQVQGGNSVAGQGGGICCWGTAEIINCSIIGNGRAGDAMGVGVYCDQDKPVIVSNCIIANNRGGGESWYSSPRGGGGILGAHTVRNSLIIDNSTFWGGGGLDRCANIQGCTILGNTTYSGDGGVANYESVTNSIIWGNWSYYDYAQIAPSFSVTYSCIQDWTYGGLGNISDNPRFIMEGAGNWTEVTACPYTYNCETTLTDASKNWPVGSLTGKMINPDLTQDQLYSIRDNTATTIVIFGNSTTAIAGSSYLIYDWHLQPCSPAVNTGDPAGAYAGQTGLDGQTRVYGGYIDMGADEFQPVDPPVFIADLDLDGDVDNGDLTILVYCETGPEIPYNPYSLPDECALCPDANNLIAADLDGDGDVDAVDFAMLQRCLTVDGLPTDPSCAW